MTFADRKSPFATMLAMTACSTAALLLSACESTGGTRFASVGSSAGSGSAGGGSGGQTPGSGSGTGGDAGGGGSGSGTGGGIGSGSNSGARGGSGSTDGGTSTLSQISPVLTTAGNAVLAVSDAQGNVTTPIATALPIAQPVTGTITRILDDAGTVLVDAGADSEGSRPRIPK